MTAYYNENEPYAAEWLRNLIKEGLISDGHVDDRSISEVTAADLEGFRQCHFFAGLGGWSGALRLAGVPDGTPLWTGSCPCQPFSLAGKQEGFADARHLWPIWQRLIAQCRPAVVLGEQVASAAQWLGLVRSDLEAMDYAVGVIPVEAASAGAYHLRDRYWFVAHGKREGPLSGAQSGIYSKQEGARTRNVHVERYRASCGIVADRERGAGHRRPDQPLGRAQGRAIADRDGAGMLVDGVEPRLEGHAGNGDSWPGWQDPTGSIAAAGSEFWITGADGKARRVEPGIRLLAHGVPQRVAKLRALGNAIDLRPAAAFIKAAIGD